MNSKKLSLSADPRKIMGRKVKQLRRDGILPANVYGKKIKSLALTVNTKEFGEIYKQAGETQVLELIVKGEKTGRPTLIHQVQVDPVNGMFLHADFRQVDLTQKIEAEVPFEFVGEAPGVAKGGVLVHVLNSVKVEALPNDIPEKFTVDVTALAEINDTLTLKDLKLDTAKVKILVEDETMVVAKVEPQAAEEAEPVAEPTEEVAAEGEEKKEEDKAEEKPAEGQKEEAKSEEKKE